MSSSHSSSILYLSFICLEMHHCVPNFELRSAARELKVDDDDDDDDDIDALMPAMLANFASETELMELVWRKGPVLNPVRGGARTRVPDPGTDHGALPVGADVSVAEVTTRLFAEDDEMTLGLNYYMREIENGGGGDLYSGTLVPPPPDENQARASGESTVVGLNLIPAVEHPEAAPRGEHGTGFTRDSASNWDRTSPLRKRKASEGDESEYQSGENDEFEFEDEKKDHRRSVALRRSRAADVHNLSERKRRDRINEKMKALQELIPRCSKSDKASMLDEAIEYLKSLQLQVQMMSMGCSMNPVMLPGVQSFLQPMGMGMGMGMGVGVGVGVGMGMGMNMEMGTGIGPGNATARDMQSGGMGMPLPPFRPILPCLPLAGSSQCQPLMTSFRPPNFTNLDQMRAQANNLQALPFYSLRMQNPHIGQIQQIGDPYHYSIISEQKNR